MKVPLDENLPHALRRVLPGHEVSTVAYLGWESTRNGALMARAAAEGVEVLLTLDNGIEHEHNIAGLPLMVVLVRSKNADLQNLLPHVDEILKCLERPAVKGLMRVGRK